MMKDKTIKQYMLLSLLMFFAVLVTLAFIDISLGQKTYVLWFISFLYKPILWPGILAWFIFTLLFSIIYTVANKKEIDPKSILIRYFYWGNLGNLYFASYRRANPDKAHAEIPRTLCDLFWGIFIQPLKYISLAFMILFYLIMSFIIFFFNAQTINYSGFIEDGMKFTEHQKLKKYAPWKITLAIGMIYSLIKSVPYLIFHTSEVVTVVSSSYFLFSILAIAICVVLVLLIRAFVKSNYYLELKDVLKSFKEKSCLILTIKEK